VPEAASIFGLFFHVFDCPDHDHSGFHEWVVAVHAAARRLLGSDANLKEFVKVRRAETREAAADSAALERAAKHSGWDPDQPYDPARMRDILLNAPGLVVSVDAVAAAMEAAEDPMFTQDCHSYSSVKMHVSSESILAGSICTCRFNVYPAS
jgi:hypothetical protein